MVYLVFALISLFSLFAFAEGEVSIPVSTGVMIRHAVPRDYEEMAKASKNRSSSEIQDLVDRPSRVSLVAVFDHRVIGYAVYDLQADKLVVSELNVATEFANRGVAKRLAENITQTIDENGSKRSVKASLPLDNLEGLKALSEIGYTVKGSRDNVVNLGIEASKVRRFSPQDLAQKTFYQRLAVPDDANSKTIQSAYEKLMNSVKEQSARQLLKQAYQTLIDPSKRALYDENTPSFPSLQHLTRQSVSEPEDVPLRTVQPQSYNLYERLGVPQNSSRQAIKKGYRDALICAASVDEQRLIHQAFAVLSDPHWKERYDNYLSGSEFGRESRISIFLELAPKHPREPEIKTSHPRSDDIYDWLGIDRNADREAIQKAFFERQERMESSEQELLALKAYKILRDPILKTYYDTFAQGMGIAEREALIERMWQDDNFRKEATEELSKKGYGIVEHRQPSAKEAIELYHDFYKILGVPPNAELTEIQQAYAHKRGNEQDIENAYDVLSGTETRKYYDSILSALRRTDFSEREYILRNLISTAKIAKRLDALEKNPTLDHLLEVVYHGIPDLTYSPSLLLKFFDLVDDITKQPYKAISLADKIELLRALNKARGNFPSLDEELLRTRITKSAISSAKSSPDDMEKLLSEYLVLHPPDALSEAIRKERDLVKPKPVLVSDGDISGKGKGTDCDDVGSLI